MKGKQYYIKKLGQNSKSELHELIEECLTYYNVYGTNELSLSQLEEFCAKKGIC